MPLAGHKSRSPKGAGLRNNGGMKIACLLHAPFEGPGTIAAWAARRGHEFRTVNVYGDEALPELESFDLLVVMGGPMSVHDEAGLGWMKREKALVRRCLEAERFVLGVCLGSQMLAEALGGRVYRNRHKEIGWFAVERTAGSGLLAGLPERFTAFHWHGETYDLPPGTALAARSLGCAVQAFEFEKGLGLQFHLEMTAEGIAALARECAADIGRGPYEQTAEEMVAGSGECAEMAGRMAAILDRIEARVANRLSS